MGMGAIGMTGKTCTPAEYAAKMAAQRIQSQPQAQVQAQAQPQAQEVSPQSVAIFTGMGRNLDISV